MFNLHPPMVHFVIALTISGTLFEILYFVTKREVFSNASLLNFLLAVPFGWGAWFTGHQQEEIVRDFIKNTYASSLLETHETVGLIVALLVTVLAILKLISYGRNIKALNLAVIVVSLITSAIIVYQGNIGGKMVYLYGVGVKPVMEGQR